MCINYKIIFALLYSVQFQANAISKSGKIEQKFRKNKNLSSEISLYKCIISSVTRVQLSRNKHVHANKMHRLFSVRR